ncbi:hypothetical protein L9T92_24795, partial [Pseudomonas putida]|nr:hypothetical protein [Pseudomonas putida]
FSGECLVFANSTLAKNHDDHPLSPAGRLRLVQLHHFPGHDPLTARDVCQVLREAVFGRRTMTKIGSQSWEQVYACHFEVDIEGWRITIYNDCDELDYCERCVSPDG